MSEAGFPVFTRPQFNPGNPFHISELSSCVIAVLTNGNEAADVKRLLKGVKWQIGILLDSDGSDDDTLPSEMHFYRFMKKQVVRSTILECELST